MSDRPMCANCGQRIEQTQPYLDGYIHVQTGRERCDPMYPQSCTASPYVVLRPRS